LKKTPISPLTNIHPQDTERSDTPSFAKLFLQHPTTLRPISAC
jgi:hypothetical protein